jgi:hypothetical protein
MTTTCPSGHASASADYCDRCGARIAGPAPAGRDAEPTSVLEPVTASVPCPACGTLRSAGERFCEACGFDFAGARDEKQVPGTSWEVVVSADREHFERVAAADIAFPESAAPRVVALDRAELRIGRGKAQGIRPEIDLATAPEDPAVSHAHAMLVREGDGTYALVDLGSTNGTIVNDLAEPIAANTRVPLADGDRIRLGAWTAITVRAVRPPN